MRARAAASRAGPSGSSGVGFGRPHWTRLGGARRCPLMHEPWPAQAGVRLIDSALGIPGALGLHHSAG